MNKEDLIREITDVLDKCSVKLLEYLLIFTKHTQKVWDK